MGGGKVNLWNYCTVPQYNDNGKTTYARHLSYCYVGRFQRAFQRAKQCNPKGSARSETDKEQKMTRESNGPNNSNTYQLFTTLILGTP